MLISTTNIQKLSRRYMYRFIESIRVIDGEAELLHQHLLRIEKTCHNFGLNNPLNTDTLQKILKQAPKDNQLYKLRISYGLHTDDFHEKDSEKYSFSFIPYIFPRIRTLQTVHHDEIEYSFKYSNRDVINELFGLRNENDDILIIRNGMVTDTSFCNVAFFDGHGWYCPKTPLLHGTRMAELIHRDIIIPEIISTDTISEFEKIRLYNSMIPWTSALEFPVSQIRR